MYEDLRHISKEFSKDFNHEVGLSVFINHKGDGYGYASVRVQDGSILAWDGWYFNADAMPPSGEHGPLIEVIDEDDQYSRVSEIARLRQLAWLEPLSQFLNPAFSLADLAAETVEIHGDKGASDLEFYKHTVAYFPTTLKLLSS